MFTPRPLPRSLTSGKAPVQSHLSSQVSLANDLRFIYIRRESKVDFKPRPLKDSRTNVK